MVNAHSVHHVRQQHCQQTQRRYWRHSGRTTRNRKPKASTSGGVGEPGTRFTDLRTCESQRGGVAAPGVVDNLVECHVRLLTRTGAHLSTDWQSGGTVIASRCRRRVEGH